MADGGVSRCEEGTRRMCEGSARGECSAGEAVCVDGTWSECSGGIEPAPEVCDGRDNDCDGLPDGPAATAACGSANRADAVACSAGECRVATCTAGFLDCDRAFANGCEERLGSLSACGGCGVSCGWSCESAACNDAASVGAGSAHTCSVQTGGAVWCWGRNEDGQLGDGTDLDRLVPTRSMGVSDATTVRAGSTFNCALRRGGTVVCWGFNTNGQLAIGRTSDVEPPSEAISLTAVESLSLGEAHGCAVRMNGSVYCWGQNAYGQLGDGTSELRSTPVVVNGLPPIQSVAAGSAHTCAVSRDHRLWCWGDNTFGNLGTGGGSVSRPTLVDLENVTDVAAGYAHTCARTDDGRLWCWGDNSLGALGDGSREPRSTPTLVDSLENVYDVFLGPRALRTCAVLGDNSLHCWGSNNSGAVGAGSEEDVLTPLRILEGASEAALGAQHTCATLLNGGVRCWGSNTVGQLGDGTAMRRRRPSSVLSPDL